jgi:hypothetical protein
LTTEDTKFTKTGEGVGGGVWVFGDAEILMENAEILIGGPEMLMGKPRDLIENQRSLRFREFCGDLWWFGCSVLRVVVGT